MLTCPSCGRENPDDARFCNACGADLAPEATREARKTVTVLFCDVTGSTALGERLDPESLRHVMARYFEAAKQVIERHGGTVEKFIGDAVMAVFGIPVVHEDDALRAVRAADELRTALTKLNEDLAQEYGTQLELRTGVNTGEVVTGTAERLATGDAVNVGSRLEHAAQPGEVLLGEKTYRLVRDAVEVEPAGPLELKGKTEPVAAYRLVRIRAIDSGIERRHGAPMIGRERQKKLLEDAFANAVGERKCHLFTVLGTAGVGKSRIAAEFLARIDGATVARGRCLSYGEGISYWPVTEAVKPLVGPAPDARLTELGLDGASVTALAPVLSGEAGATSADELAWAVRKLLEACAAERPLVVVFDDVHWGEPTFLDLVEHVADFSRDAPILLLCLARPELLDRRPSWGGGKLNATTVLLEPLGAAETEELIETLVAGEQVDEDLRTRILESAGGNPLFVEEMLAMLKERRPGGDVAVPPTIQALLAARLDQLEAGERGVLERGAVEGQVFHRGAVLALGPEEPQVSSRLMTLVRKDLVRFEQATMPGDEAFRFRHLLIRDAAYDALPKATRAELHERFAEWLEEHGVALVEFDEILGYHLEQAFRYREELGPLDAHGDELGARAGRRFAAAGARALARGDTPGAVNLLDRAASLLAGSGSEGIAVLIRLGYTLTQAGDFGRAGEALREALESAQESGDRLLDLRARIEELHLRLYVDPEGRSDDARAAAERIVPELEGFADDEGLARAWQLVSITELMACRYGPTADALERALVHARRAGDRALEADIRFWLGCAIGLGPTPAPEAGARCRELVADSDSPLARISLNMSLGVVAAQTGDLDEARRLVGLAREQLADLGMPHFEASTSMWVALVELRAGNPAAAEAAARPANQLLESLGEQSFRSTVVAFLAEAVYRQGRYDEALDLTRAAEDAAASDDIYSQALLRGTRAKILAQSRDFEQAETVAREAVALAERGDALDLHADMLLDLGEVLALADRAEEANEALEAAGAVYERKGNVAGAEQARSRLGQVRTP